MIKIFSFEIPSCVKFLEEFLTNKEELIEFQ